MPLIKHEKLFANTQLLLWKVTEPLDDLLIGCGLCAHSNVRISQMKSEMHQRAFLSVRHLLAKAGYTDSDLYYDDFGKPNLYDGKHISISHSHEYAAVIISDEFVGIDLEWAREKIIRIAKKFAVRELPFLHVEQSELILMLTVIWGVKESIFKIRNEPGISFKDHITVLPFKIEDKVATGRLHFGNVEADFDVHFEIVGEFVLVYAFETQP